MTSGIIYEIANTSTGKCYIGSTCNKEMRFANHRSLLNRGLHHCKPLQEEWSLYGQEAFSFNVLEKVGEKELCATERNYIEEYTGLGKCYNGTTDIQLPGLAPIETVSVEAPVKETI